MRLDSTVGFKQTQAGFTLVELMIVVVIVGILASVAYPAYQEYGRRAKRTEAKALLVDSAARMERFYSNNNQYATTVAAGNLSAATESGYHTLSIGGLGADNQTYTLTATPSGYTDAKCGAMTLTNTGLRGEGGSGSVEDCWEK